MTLSWTGVREACAWVAGAPARVRIDDDAIAAYAACLPLGTRRQLPHPVTRCTGGTARDSARLLAHPGRDQLRLGLVSDAAKARRALGLRHDRGGLRARFATRGPWRPPSSPRSTPREIAAASGPGPRARADGPVRRIAARSRRTRTQRARWALRRGLPTRRWLGRGARRAPGAAGSASPTPRLTRAARPVPQARPDRCGGPGPRRCVGAPAIWLG